MQRGTYNRIALFLMITSLLVQWLVYTTIVQAQEGGRQPTFAGGESRASSIQPVTSPQSLLEAMGVSPMDIVSTDLRGSDVRALGVGTSPLGRFFPTSGDTFAILSTGLATEADRPNTEASLSTPPGGLDGLSNSQGNDLAQFSAQVNVPADFNCLQFDFAFYSEEFEEFIGSVFNDRFTAELGGTNLSIVDNNVVAPLNFAFDSQGHPIAINSFAADQLIDETNSTYDGSTPLLRARTPVNPGSTIELVFSIQDLGDSIYDSAVFMDNFVWLSDSNCVAGATPVQPGPVTEPVPIPEPITVTLVGIGLAGLAGYAQRRRNASSRHS